MPSNAYQLTVLYGALLFGPKRLSLEWCPVEAVVELSAPVTEGLSAVATLDGRSGLVASAVVERGIEERMEPS